MPGRRKHAEFPGLRKDQAAHGNGPARESAFQDPACQLVIPMGAGFIEPVDVLQVRGPDDYVASNVNASSKGVRSAAATFRPR
jgi:hypothetical protein